MRLPAPDPRQLRALARSSVRTGRDLLDVLPRVDLLLGSLEQIVERLDAVVSRIDDRATRVIVDANALTARLTEIVDEWSPALTQARPVAAHLARTWGVSEIDALAAIVSRGASLSEQLPDDLVPLIDTFRTLAPDLAELVTTSKALNEIIGSVPGLSRAKQRAEARADP